jgi:putative aldouronate transport system substrate-binding protein
MKMKPQKLIVPFVLSMLIVPAAFSLAACTNGVSGEADRITVKLAAPQSDFIEDFETNLYKLWLEERTGLRLEMTWLPAGDAEQAAKLALSTGEGLPDAYIGFGSHEIFANPNIQSYGTQGAIIPLDGLIEEYGTYTKNLFDELPEQNIKTLMTSADGHIYFMPGFSSSTITRYRQIMWVNKGWLDELGLAPPETTEQFRDLLLAFKKRDPDAIPMAGTDGYYSKQAYEYLFNAFIYNDVNNSRLIFENGAAGFAPVRDEWREALIYMRSLYEEGLYSPLSFSQDDQQMKQMANDRRDILGAFCSPGITLTALQNSPEIMERYTGIGPLTGPGGVKLSTVFVSAPKPNGVITSACEHPDEVFKLFDLMLSEEACLTGRYGTQGEDWDFAEEGEQSIYGAAATIRIINQLWNTPQNKHLCQIGPYVSRPKYSGGVTWDGNVTDGEYMNAQAALQYRGFEPEEFYGPFIYTPEEEARVQTARAGIEAHVKETIAAFITGERDVHDDGEWGRYVAEFEGLGLAEFLKTAQAARDRMAG